MRRLSVIAASLLAPFRLSGGGMPARVDHHWSHHGAGGDVSTLAQPCLDRTRLSMTLEQARHSTDRPSICALHNVNGPEKRGHLSRSITHFLAMIIMCSGFALVGANAAERSQTGADPQPSIIGEDNRHPICDSTVSARIRLSDPVGYITFWSSCGGGQASCTAWIADSGGSVFTNAHCVDEATDVEFVRFSLNLNDQACVLTDRPVPDTYGGARMLFVNKSVDITVLQFVDSIKGNPVNVYGHLSRSTTAVTDGESLWMPQHYGDNPITSKMVAEAPFCSVIDPSIIGIYYPVCWPLSIPNDWDSEFSSTCDGSGGTSGSPVLNANNEVVGLYHAEDVAFDRSRTIKMTEIEAVLPALNRPPTAVAGEDMVVAGSPCAWVQLDGTGSSDPEGRLGRFEWEIAGNLVYTGPNPAIQLCEGLHTITLKVYDEFEVRASDSVVVRVTTGTRMVVSPTDVVEFGVVPVGSYAERTYTVYNAHWENICFEAHTQGHQAFSVVGPSFTCLDPGRSGQVVVRYRPVDAGTQFATVVFDSNQNDEVRYVRGTGDSYAGTCSEPIALGCGVTVAGTNSNGEVNIDRYYVNGTEYDGYYGQEQVHVFTLNSDDSVSISACLDDCNNSGGGMDLFVCETCQIHTTSSCRRVIVSDGRLVLDGLVSSAYYIIVDSYAGAGNLGEYRLQVECCPNKTGTTSCGTGECRRTVLNCVDGVPQECVPGNFVAEVCDDLDNDCDGLADDGNPGGGLTCSTTQPGVCRDGTMTCQSGSLVCVRNQGPGPETCNDLDDNCDGATDEGNPGGGQPCPTGQPGLCGFGTTVCSGGVVICVPTYSPALEICNGLDDDCDGIADGGPISERELSGDPAEEDTPALLQRRDGTVWLVWTKSEKLVYKVSSDGGVSWGQVMAVGPAQESVNTQADLAEGMDGKLRLVFQSNRFGKWDLFYSEYDDSTATWPSPARKLIDVGTASDYLPSITCTGDGTLWVVFTSADGSPGPKQIVSSNRGVSWTGPEVIANSAGMHGSVAAMADGSVWVVYWNGAHIVFQKYDETGWSASYPVAAAPAGNGVYLPDILQGHDGRIWVGWTQFSANAQRLLYATSVDNGSTWTQGTQTVEYPARDTAIKLARVGYGLSAVFSSIRTGSDDIFVEDLAYPIGQPCSVGLWSCQRNGQLICSADGTRTVCNVVPGTSTPEICNGLDDDCDGVVDVPPEVSSVEILMDSETVSWGPATEQNYQVLRGVLDRHPVGSGSEVCLGTSVTDEQITDASIPPAGGGYWYLVRASNSCGHGSWGTASGEIPRVSDICDPIPPNPQQICEQAGGFWDECGPPALNCDCPGGGGCPTVCVPMCRCGGAQEYACPAGECLPVQCSPPGTLGVCWPQ